MAPMARIGLDMGRPMGKWQMKMENQGVRDGREHELEDTVDERGNPRAAY